MVRKNRGFTMVELLLVVLVMAAAAGILFPVLAGARRGARVTSCLSNLRQLGMAYHLYAADWEPRVPQLRQVMLGGYLKQRELLFCPDDDRALQQGLISSYVYRASVPPDFRQLTELRDPPPAAVVMSCRHHLQQRAVVRGDTAPLSAPRYPYVPVLRWSGAVEQLAYRSLRRRYLPGTRPAYIYVYPGEPWYRSQENQSDG